MNLTILQDSQIPFTDQKLKLLEQLVTGMHLGNPMKIQESQHILESLQESQIFWLQTDSIIETSNNSQTVFFALMALHSGVKVR